MNRAKQKTKVYTEQVNVRVTPALKNRIRKIQNSTDIDAAEEIRRAIERTVEEIEREGVIA